MEEKKWLRLPLSIKPLLPEIRNLSQQGLNKTQICKLLKMGKNTFNKYKEVNEEFELGRAMLASEVSSSFKKNLLESYSDRVHLSKQLRLFSSGYSIGKVTNMESAQNAMSTSLEQFTLGNISIEDLEATRKALATFIDSVSSTVLEERLKQVEQQLAERSPGNGI